MNQRKSLKNLLSAVLFLVLVALLGLYIWKNREDMGRMLNLSPQMIIAMLLLATGSCVMNCVYHLVILQTYRLPLSLTDWMGVVSVSNAIAYVLPLRADLVFSAAYYKRVKGLAYTRSASMAAGNIVFGVAFSLLEILAALLCIGIWDGAWPAAIWTAWALGAVVLVAFIVFSLVFQHRMPAFWQKYRILRDVTDGFVALLRNRPMLWRLLGCLAANNLFQLGLHMVCFRAIGIPITLYQALLYSSVSWLAGIVAIVPGNIGIKESVMGAATLLLGMVFQNGVTVSLLQRAALLMVHLLMGLVFALPVYRRFNQEKDATTCPE